MIFSGGKDADDPGMPVCAYDRRWCIYPRCLRCPVIAERQESEERDDDRLAT